MVSWYRKRQAFETASNSKVWVCLCGPSVFLSASKKANRLSYFSTRYFS